MSSTLTPHPRLLVRWFVQYNPFFTASALCVLGGIMLARQALGSSADVALTIVLELYQLVVIGLAALLYRRLLERRPAAILGVIALVFLVDPTLQLSALAASHAFAMSAVWLVSFALKWRALQWAFHLRLSRSAQLLPLAAAALVVGMTNARVLGIDVDGLLPAAIAIAVFGLGLLAVHCPLRAYSRTALGEVGTVMFPRLARASIAIGVGGVAYQVANVTLASGASAVLPAAAAALLVVAIASKRESVLWAFAAPALLVFAKVGHASFGCALAALAIASVARAHPPRVLVVASVLGYVAVAHNFGAPSTAPVVASALLATAVLVWSLVRRRAWSAVPALALLHANALITLWSTFAPSSRGTWAIVALAAGFVLLPAGVALQRRLGRALAILEAESAVPPSTSAAPSSRITPSLLTETVSPGSAQS